jgi:hypothetical protein
MALFRPEISHFFGNSDAIPSKIPDFRTKSHSFLAQTEKSKQLQSIQVLGGSLQTAIDVPVA